MQPRHRYDRHKPATRATPGWVVGGDIKINTPFITPGDNFITEVNYTQGATEYLFNFRRTVKMGCRSGGTAGYGVGSDCVYAGTAAAGTGTSCLLTTAWEVDAAYEHYWTPQWHQSLVVNCCELRFVGELHPLRR